MKKIFLIFAICFMVVSFSEAQEIEVVEEVRPSVTKYKIIDLLIHQRTKQAIVTIGKGYMDDSDFIIVSEFNVIFQNVVDNPETPEDETSSKYTQFINFIEINPAKVKQALQIELGL